jgi:hypothetical protein
MVMTAINFNSVFQKILMLLIAAAIMVFGLLLSTQAFSQTIDPGLILAQNSQRSENIINVRLIGAAEYELVEVFGKVLNNSQGVLEARRHGSRIVPDNPRACFAVWRVRIHEPDPSRLQANIIKAIRDTGVEVDLLKRVRPGKIITGEIQFMVY